ncbi:MULTISPECIES: hypothetical protein [unclassified Novosphingobium]|uniref:hypothetical protein n=1 Tax=unclassified Novosphingobium TaxID=2644732 RepID=UPI001356C025|nr:MULTISPECIES: hypothetical protein [unclassified Novosphingobium]
MVILSQSMEQPLTDLTRSIKRNDLHIALQKLERHRQTVRNSPVSKASNRKYQNYVVRNIIRRTTLRPLGPAETTKGGKPFQLPPRFFSMMKGLLSARNHGARD